MNENMMNGSGKGLMVAAVVGAAVGAGVALLFAPCSGKETRGWISSQRRSVAKKAANAMEQGKKVIRSVAENVGELAEVVSEHTEAGNTSAKSGVRRMHS